MFSKKPTKAELRHQLQAEVSQFLQGGGTIKQVDMGATGLVDGKYSSLKGTFSQPTQSRTPVHSLLAAIDSRRSAKKGSTPKNGRSRPTQKIIYDDFGEPVRTVWVDE
jgi:hypothetical protein